MRFELHWLALALILILILILPRSEAESGQDSAEGLPQHVSRHMDTAYSPCQDFYAHACGNWSAVHEKDPYRSLLEQLDYDYQERLAGLLEREESQSQSSDREARFLQLPRDFYASCRRSLDMPQVLSFLKQLVKVPQLGNAELSVALTAAFRLNVLVEMGKDKSRNIWLQLLLRSDPEWDSTETNREPLQRQQFDQLWISRTADGWLSKELFWRHLVQLEREMMREDDDKDDEYGSSEDNSLLDQQHTPTFWMLPWRRSPPSFGYIRHMSRLLTEQMPDFLVPYILLRLAVARPRGSEWQVSRSECAEQCRQLLSHPSAWLLEKDQPRLPEDRVLQGIFRVLKHRFGQKLRANRNALSRKTLRYLLAKLKHMTLRLSVLPRPRKSDSEHSLELRIERHYHDLRLNATDYFGNLLAALQHSRAQTVERLLTPMFFPWLAGQRPTARLGEPLPVEAHGFGSFGSPFYMLPTNTLVVPLSLLGPPLYSPGQSPLLTYSSLGFILGHELMHGFTPEAAGMQNPSLALELLRNRRFRDETACLRRRYGAEQLDEKFADANGLELAYSAYFDAAEGDRWWEENSNSNSNSNSSSNSNAIEPVDTLILRQQHFFLNFAQFFCSDEDSWQDNDDHGTDRSRVNDAVANFEPFQQAFNCPSYLNVKKYRKRSECRLY